MLSTTASRILAKAHSTPFSAQTVRMLSSLPTPPSHESRRQMHTTSAVRSDATVDKIEVPVAEPVAKTGGIVDRFVTTFEVTISKIFPAGFGWQTASIVADSNFGFAPDSLNFALTTGVGDALGVLGGHVTYYGLKKLAYDSKINMTAELHTGALLGSAAFCSGTAWQPLVDALQGANLPFLSVFTGTWVGCGLAFYAGLRMARTILSGPMKYVEEPTYENSKADASLSVVIGGATGFFVGTDAAYLPEQNFLIDVVGIQDGTPDLTGCVIAGSSTSLGFLTSQSTFNVIFPAGKCWND
eukprot:Nitzschia sp. Nitz4//scaffold386_size12300//1284//2180//NITZ4_008992-RA/size12300-processed-gene-0.27-mRNA-1//-1//CDS//3329549960//1849//frame0